MTIEVYVLLADGDGTMRSICEPFGVAVTSEQEAEKYVKDGHVGFFHSFCKVRIFETKEEALEWKYPGFKEEYLKK